MWLLWLVLLPVCWLGHFLWSLYHQHDAHDRATLVQLEKEHGPGGWPVVGFVTRCKTSTEISAKLWSLIRQYGSPCCFKIGPLHIVLLSTPEHAEAFFTHKRNIKKSNMYAFLQPWLGNGLLTSTGAEWHGQRKQLTGSFHFHILRDFVPTMNKAARTLVDRVRYSASMNGDEDKVMISELVTRCALDVIMETSAGLSIDAQHQPDHPYHRALEQFGRFATERMQRPWLWPPTYWITPSGLQCARALRTLRSFTADIVKQKWTEFEQYKAEHCDETENAKKPQALLDTLIRLRADGAITDSEVQDQVDTFIFEGHDTTSQGLQWTWYCLALHPEAQEKARREVMSLLGDDPSVDPTAEDLREMKWLECCIKEGLRLYPPVPMPARQLQHPLVLDDKFTIPANTTVAVDLYIMHRDPRHNVRPECYKPERFLPENTVGRHPFAFCPFAAGLRSCIGQKYAMQEMKIVFAHLLRRYSFTTTQIPDESDLAYRLTLASEKGITITAKLIHE